MKRSEAVKKLYAIIKFGMASDHRVEVAYSNILQDIERQLGMLPPYNPNHGFSNYDMAMGVSASSTYKWEDEDE